MPHRVALFAMCLGLAVSCLPGLTSAHMFLASPKPIEGSAPTDPLDSDGSNFPCHGVVLPTADGQSMEAGSCFKLQLNLGAHGENTAVHGGGSCQLAVTNETAAEKVRDPGNWHVIYSIDGGCPANSAGNLPNSTYCASPGQDECVHTWDIPLPKGLRSGHAVMSWTWFNVVGEREMYQNCANIEITGGTGEAMGFSPPICIANISPDDVCTAAPEQTNLTFPNPGEFRTTVSATNAQNRPHATATCSLEGFRHKSNQASQSDSHTTPTSSGIAAASTSSFWSNGLPGSEALHRLATAAIVSSEPESCSPRDGPLGSEGNNPAATVNTWFAHAGTNNLDYSSSYSSIFSPVSQHPGTTDAIDTAGLHSPDRAVICASTLSPCAPDATPCSGRGKCIGEDRFGLC